MHGFIVLRGDRIVHLIWDSFLHQIYNVIVFIFYFIYALHHVEENFKADGGKICHSKNKKVQK